MADANEDQSCVDAPDLVTLFDELEGHESEDVRKLAKAIRGFAYIPSTAGEWYDQVASHDAMVTKAGGTSIIAKFLTLDTAKSTFITSSTRDKMARYLERYTTEKTSFRSFGQRTNTLSGRV